MTSIFAKNSGFGPEPALSGFTLVKAKRLSLVLLFQFNVLAD